MKHNVCAGFYVHSTKKEPQKTPPKTSKQTNQPTKPKTKPNQQQQEQQPSPPPSKPAGFGWCIFTGDTVLKGDALGTKSGGAFL